MTDHMVEYRQKDKKDQTAKEQGKETIMKKAIDKIKNILAAMARAYKEAAPYMNYNRYEYPTMQIAFW